MQQAKPAAEPPKKPEPQKPATEKLGLFSSIKRAASKKFAETRKSPTFFSKTPVESSFPLRKQATIHDAPRSKSDSARHAVFTRQVSETVSSSTVNPVFDKCHPKKPEDASSSQFPVRKSTSEVESTFPFDKSFPFVKKALSEFENSFPFFKRNIETSFPSASEIETSFPATSSTEIETTFPYVRPTRRPDAQRPASVSPKHTFTFKIVLKKVESTPNASLDKLFD